jgi:hypothetical protein
MLVLAELCVCVDFYFGLLLNAAINLRYLLDAAKNLNYLLDAAFDLF